MKMFLVVLAFTVPLALIVGYFARREPIRNGYQTRQRTYLKGGRTVILEPKDDPRIVGDGARDVPTQAKYPKRVRSIEPEAM